MINDKIQIVLASQSKRREEILKMIGLKFETIPSNVSEKIDLKIPVNLIPKLLSKKKAHTISNLHPDKVVIGADTVVVYRNKIMGKPKDKNESRLMLKKLSGNSHMVITGVTIIQKNKEIIRTFSEITEVFVNQIPKHEIEYYIDNFNTLEKAGGYGIQEWFCVWIKKINGCYYNVMGLPVSKFYNHFNNIASKF